MTLLPVHCCHCWSCRGKGSDGLMIDGLVGQCGERVADLWRRDKGGTGLYPPPTLHVSFITTSWEGNIRS